MIEQIPTDTTLSREENTQRALELVMRKHTHIYLVVPTQTRAQVYKQWFAQQHSIAALGIHIATLDEITRDFWQLYGDDHTLISVSERRLLLANIWLATSEEKTLRKGMVQTLNTLCTTRFFTELAQDTSLPKGLSDLEKNLVMSLQAYKAKLAAGKLYDQSQALDKLPKLVSSLASDQKPAFVFADFLQPSDLENKVMQELAEVTSCYTVQQSLATNVLCSAPNAQVAILNVRGAYAEPQQIAAHLLDNIAKESHNHICVCAPQRSFNTELLAQKLASGGCKVHVQDIVCFNDLAQGRVLLHFIDAVQNLYECAQTWQEKPEDNDMSWWPAQSVIDFLLSDISGVSKDVAYEYDANWRSDRKLTPQLVLHAFVPDMFEVQENASKHTKKKCLKLSQTMREFVKAVAQKNMGKAFKFLSQELASRTHISFEVSLVQACVQKILSCLENARYLGYAREYKQNETAYMQAIHYFIEHTYVSRKVCYNEGRDALCDVTICSFDIASDMAAKTFDEVVVCGMDTKHMGVADDVSSLDVLLEQFGYEKTKDLTMLERMRRRFIHVAATVRHILCCEYASHDANGECFPSVLLHDVKDACDDKGQTYTEQTVGSESHTLENFSIDAGCAKHALVQKDNKYAAGIVSDDVKPYIAIPAQAAQTGVQDLFLSPTQIEAYLACPYKWFVQRRLKLESLDKQCGPIELGNFVHGVMEEVHKQLFEQRRDDPAAPGRVCKQNMTDVTRILENTMQTFLEAQNAEITCHDERDCASVEKTKNALRLTIEKEAQWFEGFYPREFEYKFGKNNPYKYAGCYINGSIDRIDVDNEGNALIIDYKNTASPYMAKEYAVYADHKKEKYSGPHDLPRYIQTLIYAKAAQDIMGYNVVGAIYIGTQKQVIAGAVENAYAARVFGETDTFSNIQEASILLPHISCADLVQETEKKITQELSKLKAGEIPACPFDETSCKYCPVLATCEYKKVK